MSASARKRLIVIMGPTAVGKTRLAIQLASRLNSEIISADSRQVFKEMTKGTAKPSDIELRQITHHFINCKSIHEAYNAGEYGEDALRLITKLFERYENVVMCGGSGLYIKSVLEGFDDMPNIPEGMRQKLIDEYEEHGLNWLQQQVETEDPDYFAEMDQKNPQRLIRALELIRATGEPASKFRKNKKTKRSFEVVKIGLELDRKLLYHRINERVDLMIANGLLEEVKSLYPSKSLNALQTVGYLELFDHLDGVYDKEEAIRLIKRNTRRYAKRQLTWFKKDNETKWFLPDEFQKIIQYLNEQ